MTEDFRNNTTHQMRLAIERFTAKHRRENPQCPTPHEYLDCWAQALLEANQSILYPRRPGRPAQEQANNCRVVLENSGHATT
jgi:hypothetical protein